MTVVATLCAWMALVGGIQGRVLSPDGRAVPGAVVSVASVGSDTTDAAGVFHLGGIPEGRWDVRVWADGFEPVLLGVRVPDGGVVRLDVELVPERAPADTVEVHGVVRDGTTLRGVPDALIEVTAARSVSSGRDGSFTMRLLPGEWTLRASAPGYRSRTVPVEVGGRGTTTLQLFLDIEPLPVPGLTVGGSRPEERNRRIHIDEPTARVLDSMSVRMTPTTVERDVFRAAQMLPSVTPVSDFSTALFVRGSTPDQTRVFLDGTPIYNPYHVGGFVAAFVPEAVESSVLSPGGLPASAPSALAGVMDIRTIEPRADSMRWAGGVGLLSTSATVDGPLFGKGVTFLLSGRRTYVDAATDLASAVGAIDQPIPYGFSDILGKVRLASSRNGALTASAYADREHFVVGESADVDQVDAHWGSHVLALRGERMLGPSLRVEGGVGSSRFGGRLTRTRDLVGSDLDPAEDPDTTRADVSLRAVSVDASLRADLGAHQLWLGGRAERTRFDHDLRPEFSDEGDLPTLVLRGAIHAGALYARDRWSLASGWTLDAGLRGERARGRWHALPRGRIEWDGGRGRSVAISSGRYLQDWWSLRDEESAVAQVVSYDLLAPVPDARPLPTAWDLVAETRTRISSWQVGVDVFRKGLHDVPSALPEVDAGRGRLVIPRDSVRLGRGSVMGIEVSAAGRWGGFTIGAGYRWQRERRALDSLSFIPRTDRRHRLVVSATRPYWGEREIALTATWMSGIPITPVTAVLPGLAGVDSNGRLAHPGFGGHRAYGAPNTDRLPSYLRIDLETRGGWDLTLFGRRGVIEPYVSVLNILNAHNALLSEDSNFLGRPTRRLYPQLPIFPSFGIRWRF